MASKQTNGKETKMLSSFETILILVCFTSFLIGLYFLIDLLNKRKFRKKILKILDEIAPNKEVPEFKFKDKKADKEIQKIINYESYHYCLYDPLPKEIKDLAELLKIQFSIRKGFKKLIEKNKNSFLTWEEIEKGLHLSYRISDIENLKQTEMCEKARISANKIWRIALGLWKRNIRHWLSEARNNYPPCTNVLGDKMEEIDKVTGLTSVAWLEKFNRGKINELIAQFSRRRIEFLAHELKNNLHIYPYRRDLAEELAEFLKTCQYIKPEHLGLNMQLIQDCQNEELPVSLVDYNNILNN